MSTLTIEQIAQLANISRSTVSRVLNNHPHVKTEVRERVQRVITEYNYSPRAAARSLASNRTNSIGLLLPVNIANLFQDPFFPTMIQGVMQAANERNYFVMLSMITTEKEASFYSTVLRSRPFDGLVMLAHVIEDPLLPLLIQSRTPLVLCDRHPYLHNLSWIDIGNRETGRRATLHLIEHGYRRIAHISGPLVTSAGMDRRDGYKQALTEQGMRIDNNLIAFHDFTSPSGYTAMRRLLALPVLPDAVFVASDLGALGAMRAIADAGLRVPHDIAVIGVDDLPAGRDASVPLTTMHQPIAGIGAAAAHLLMDQIEQQNFEPSHLELSTHLVVRESCGCPYSETQTGTAPTVSAAFS